MKSGRHEIFGDQWGQACFAVAAAGFVGFVWWILHGLYFVELYWYLVPLARARGFVPQGFDGVFSGINLVTIAGQCVTVGCVAGFLAPCRPYLITISAMGLTFLLKIPQEIFSFRLMGGGSPHAAEVPLMVALYWLLYATAPFYGAFIGQSLKPRPRAGIEWEEALQGVSLFYSRFAAVWQSASAALGIGLLLGMLWAIFFMFAVFQMMGAQGEAFLFAFAAIVIFMQGLTIGFFEARVSRSRPYQKAVCMTVLIFAADIALIAMPFFGTGVLLNNLDAVVKMTALHTGAAVIGVYIAT